MNRNTDVLFYGENSASFFPIAEGILARRYWSRAMVYESIDNGNNVTYLAVPVVLLLVFRKKINVIVKTNRPQFSMVYTLIDHRNDAIKCSKLCSETTSPAARGSTSVLNI